MESGFEALIKRSASLPSPPAVAMQVIELANRADVNAQDLKAVIEKDPALTSKVLRVVNSAIYAPYRQVETLSQAIVIMGFNATVSLALSFSLVSALQKQQGKGLDYTHYWRRTFLSATTARILAEQCGEVALEEVFLAGLLQDIGMQAIDKVYPEVYDELDDEQYQQDRLLVYESERLEVDHAEVGGWLLRNWQLPDRTALAVEASHNPLLVRNTSELGTFVRCVALSGLVADIFINKDESRPYEELFHLASHYLKMDHEQLDAVLARTSELIPEIELLFNTRLTDAISPLTILEQARQALLERNLVALRDAGDSESPSRMLKKKAQELEYLKNRDELTGLHNRGFAEVYLAEAFADAKESGVPISLAFADLDNFKRVNDQYGHDVGDLVLREAASILADSVRAGDIVARYGGEEFVVLLPGAEGESANRVCERIVSAFSQRVFNVAEDKELSVTVSIGVVTQDAASDFADVDAFVEAADSAMYTAKLHGRNQVLPFIVRQSG